MNIETLEKILNLFDHCLQINIDRDLIKILPFPRKLILDLLSDSQVTAISYLSSDQNTLHFQNNLGLCPIDQNRGGSCQSSSCEQLHICKDYLLNKTCSQSLGKCSYSHSLSTNHNELILSRFNFSSQDEQILQFISHLNKLSLNTKSKIVVQSLNNLNISDHLIDQWLGEHKSLINEKRRINSTTVELIVDDDEVASMMEDLILQHHPTTVLIKKDISIENNDRQEKDLDNEVEFTNGQTSVTSKSNDQFSADSSVYPNFGRGRGRQEFNKVPPLTNQSLSRRLGSNEKKPSFSHRLISATTEHHSPPSKTKSSDNSSNSTPELISYSDQYSRHTKSESTDSFSKSFLPKIDQKRNEIPANNSSSPNHVPDENISSESSSSNSKTPFVLRGHQTKPKQKSPIPTINYLYTKPFTDEHLCYLLGPGKQFIENDQHEITSCLPSGYCRVMNNQQGKDIEKRLYSILPKKLNIDLVQINDNLALLICSAAAELIFQQNQIHFAIISEPSNIQLNIEIINPPSIIERRQSSSASSIPSQLSSDGKFHINTTNSTIDVISGDICQIPIDMMICISTSNNLRESVLRHAGPATESQFKDRYRPTDALLLDGGLTAARKILFVPWQTEIEITESNKTQKSLSDLVKWCIEQAHQRKLKSISFPPIGTGQLGLDPYLVCEAMIGAASECLHQYTIDVVFVIYPSNRSYENDDECYQVFKIYLHDLCEQIKLTKISTPTVNHQTTRSKSLDTKKQSIRRDIQSKRILTLSDESDVSQDQNLLIKSLEKLMYEKTFDLSLIESSYLNQVDLLIDICLKCNIYPRIDYSREEIILRGDRDSCFQCFFNLREGKKVFEYSYVLTENGEKCDEQKLNSFISLKIDEAFAVGESNICVDDEEKMIYNIDLNKLQVQINRNRQSAFLVKKQLNADCKIGIPSLLMIHTKQIKSSSYQTLDCFRAFEESMSTANWQIERIESIENYPLYIHFMNKKKKEKSQLYFHGCSYSSVQSIIHYGFHSTNVSNYGNHFENPSMGSICLTRDVLNSHLYGSRRSTDGKHYLFAVQLAKDNINDDWILLSNKDAHLALPTYLIVYQRKQHFR